MELIDAIYHRRACRDYTARAVSRSVLIELLKAAVQAPTGMHAEPWAFGVFQGKARLQDYSDRAKMHYLRVFDPGGDPHAMHHDMLGDPKFNIFYNATSLVVVYAKPAGQFASVDCCLAAQNLMLAAHGMGLGTCPIGFAQPWLDLSEVKAELGIPDDYTAVLPIIVGYPAKAPDAVARKEPDIAIWR
jgi:nitroreductase